VPGGEVQITQKELEVHYLQFLAGQKQHGQQPEPISHQAYGQKGANPHSKTNLMLVTCRQYSSHTLCKTAAAAAVLHPSIAVAR
jgi:hypothetical protein